MNLKFLGDALDHWKGSVFEGLQSSHILNNFRVDAMVSDPGSWHSEDWQLYAKLLRVERYQIVSHRATLDKNRNEYFNEIPPTGDIFLDPDTGIKTGAVKDLRQYLKPEELAFIMNQEPHRITIVYQHVRAMPTIKRIREVLHALRSVQPYFYCASYNSGTVALLFLSLQRARIDNVSTYFRDLLGSHADNRIGILTERDT